MSESELATLGTFEASDSDRESHIVMSDCESSELNEQELPHTPGEPIFHTSSRSHLVSTGPGAASSHHMGSSNAASAMGSASPSPPAANAVTAEPSLVGDSTCEQLEAAIAINDMARVQELLAADAELLHVSGALHRAASHNHWQLCRYLLGQQADVNQAIEPQQATPLLWACSKGNAYIVKLLIDNGADLNVADSSGFTPLHLAVHSSNILMVAYVLHLEVEVDKLDSGRRSALHWACVQGDFLSVEALLKAGASPNLPDGEGTLPLHHAVYTSKSVTIVQLLLQFGADPSLLLHLLGNELQQNQVWCDGCFEAGRSPQGTLLRSSMVLSPELAKCVTTVAPTLVLPAALGMMYVFPDNLWWLGVPAGLLLAYGAKVLLARYVLPSCWHGQKAVLQSSLLAGLFCSILLWDAYIYFRFVFPVMAPVQPVLSFMVIASLVVLCWSYTTTCMLDPGTIEPKSTTQRLKTMNELIDKGLFDSVHLCTHTYVQKPFRSKYDHYLDRVVCRYDHYCPWMYNVIGLRNHRTFVIFLLTLDILLAIAGYQYFRYCQEVGGSAFTNGLVIFTAIQAVWLFVLTLVQLAQLARGVTTFELSSQDSFDSYRTDPMKVYGSLPRDHPRALEIYTDLSTLSTDTNQSLRRHTCSNHKYPTWMRVTGISQCLIIFRGNNKKSASTSRQLSAWRNCADFWCTGESIWRPRGGSGKIGGVRVDYYTLADAQSRPCTESDRMLV